MTKVGEVHLDLDVDKQPWAIVVFGGKSYQIDAYHLESLLNEWSEAVVTDKSSYEHC